MWCHILWVRGWHREPLHKGKKNNAWETNQTVARQFGSHRTEPPRSTYVAISLCGQTTF